MTAGAAPGLPGVRLRHRVAVVGAFLPPLASDDLLLEFARGVSHDVLVILRSSPDDPLPAGDRVAWLHEMAPGTGVRALDVEASSLVDALAGAMREAGVEAIVGPGFRDLDLARRLGLDYLPVDVPGPEPEAVLRRPLAHWASLPASVRARFATRVVVVGPESTGKTTLARDLASLYGTCWTSEYLRLYLDAKGGLCEPDDLPRVVAGHVATEAAFARTANRVLFCDTDPLMTLVYSRFYYGVAPAWLRQAARGPGRRHYLLLDSDVPWVADPQRDAPHAREVIRDLCREELERNGLAYTTISGDWTARLAQARQVVDRLLAED